MPSGGGRSRGAPGRERNRARPRWGGRWGRAGAVWGAGTDLRQSPGPGFPLPPGSGETLRAPGGAGPGGAGNGAGPPWDTWLGGKLTGVELNSGQAEVGLVGFGALVGVFY